MALFLSTFINKVDTKGRVSLPAQFRSALGVDAPNVVIVYESFINQAIEGCDIERIKKISQAIDDLDPFSEERDAFSATVLGGAIQLTIDGEGRIIIPQELIKKMNIKNNVVFVGKGSTFEIWEANKFNDYSLKAREIAKEKRNLLRLNKNND